MPPGVVSAESGDGPEAQFSDGGDLLAAGLLILFGCAAELLFAFLGDFKKKKMYNLSLVFT